MYCKNCGKQIDDKAYVCIHCGVKVNDCSSEQSTDNLLKDIKGRNRLIACLLGIFLGGFGGYEFYMGHFTYGILSILFCWTCIPSIIGIVRGVLVLGLTDKEFEAQVESH